VNEEATIRARTGLSVEGVRSVLGAWAANEGGVVRLDRRLSMVVGGRHFHLAAPARGSGTLEVNFEPADGDDENPRVRVYARAHWLGSWAGGALVRLVEHLAVELGG
jgi:hypothetical protein